MWWDQHQPKKHKEAEAEAGAVIYPAILRRRGGKTRKTGHVYTLRRVFFQRGKTV